MLEKEVLLDSFDDSTGRDREKRAPPYPEEIGCIDDHDGACDRHRRPQPDSHQKTDTRQYHREKQCDHDVAEMISYKSDA